MKARTNLIPNQSSFCRVAGNRLNAPSPTSTLIIRMKLPCVSILAIVALASVPSMASVVMGPLTNPANNHAYYLLSINTWTNAEAEAVSLGGHLVTINDAAEQTWVFSTFGSREVWIGLNDRIVEGTFQWVSGETSTYRNWDPGEPNNAASGSGNQDYIHIYSNTFADTARRGKWDDRSQTESFALTFYAVAEVLQGVPFQLNVFPALELAWPTVTTSRYQLQWSSSLAPNDWFNLGDPIQGTGSIYSYLASPGTTERRFYRVLTLTP